MIFPGKIISNRFPSNKDHLPLLHDATGTIVEVHQSNLKITHDAALNFFTIIDEMGVVIAFDQEEITTNTGVSSPVTNTTS